MYYRHHMELESTVVKDGDLKSNTNAECHHCQISEQCPVKIKPDHTLLIYDHYQYSPPPTYIKVFHVLHSLLVFRQKCMYVSSLPCTLHALPINSSLTDNLKTEI